MSGGGGGGGGGGVLRMLFLFILWVMLQLKYALLGENQSFFLHIIFHILIFLRFIFFYLKE